MLVSVLKNAHEVWSTEARSPEIEGNSVVKLSERVYGGHLNSQFTLGAFFMYSGAKPSLLVSGSETSEVNIGSFVTILEINSFNV